MDSTVIQEIANQLGMAADQAGQFITEQLPVFAEMKLWQLTTTLLILLFVFAASVICALISYKTAHIPSESGFHCCSWTLAAFSLTALIICTCISLPDIIGWSQYPEAMLIDMALKAVG